MIYFTSDLHAFHKNILEYDGISIHIATNTFYYRRYITNIWNSIVNKDDEVYILGDIAVGGRNKEIDEFLHGLNGLKYLIRGNHEKEIMNCAYLKDQFVWIKDYFKLKYFYNNKEYDIIMMHYPIEEWDHKNYGAIHLHGHSHGKKNVYNLEHKLNRLDVGFKASKFTLLSIEQIINKFPNETKRKNTNIPTKSEF